MILLSGRNSSLHKHIRAQSSLSGSWEGHTEWFGLEGTSKIISSQPLAWAGSLSPREPPALYPNHENYFYSCVTSPFPSMPQTSAHFTLEYKMLLYFKLFDTSSTAHAEPNLPLFPSKCYITAFSHHPPIPLQGSLMDVPLSHSCLAGWDILMIPWEYALQGKCGASSENKVVFTCWSPFFFNIFNIWVSWEQTAWWSSTQMATAFSARLQKWDMQTHLSSLAFGMWKQCLKISWVASQFSFFCLLFYQGFFVGFFCAFVLFFFYWKHFKLALSLSFNSQRQNVSI